MAAGNGNGQSGRPHLHLYLQKKLNRKKGKTPFLDYKIKKITPKKYNISQQSSTNAAHTAAQSKEILRSVNTDH